MGADQAQEVPGADRTRRSLLRVGPPAPRGGLHRGWVIWIFLLGVGALLRWRQIGTGIPADRFCDSYAAVLPAVRLSASWAKGAWVWDPGAYYYPTLYTYVLAFVDFMTRSSLNPEWTGRFLTALFGLLTAIPAYLIAQSLQSRVAGFFSALTFCVGYVFVIEGRTPSPDSLQLFLFAWALWFLLRHEPRCGRDVVLGGFLVGLATGTKWLAPLFCGPLVFILLLKSPHPLRRGFFFVGAALAGFLISTPLFVVDWPRYVATQRSVWELARGGLVGVPSGGFWGYLFAAENKTNFFPTWASLSETMGILWVLGVLLSLPILAWKARRDGGVRLWALLFGVIVSYAVLGWVLRFQAGRILLPLAFLLVTCLAIAWDDLHRRLRSYGQGRVRLSPWTWKFIRAAVPLLFLTGPGLKSLGYAHALRFPDSRLVSAHWILSHVPPGSVLLNFINGPTFPKGRYQVIQWHLLESRSQVEKGIYDSPSLRQVARQRVEWVLWNETMTRRMQGKTGVASDERYLGEWRTFKESLDRSPCVQKTFQAQSPFSPRVDVYRVDKTCLKTEGTDV